MDAISDFSKNIAEEIPFVGGLLGGGRLPINSAIPNPVELVKAWGGEQDWNWNKRVATTAKELSKPLFYSFPGGGQLKKILEGVRAVNEGGSYSINKDGENFCNIRFTATIRPRAQ